MMAFCKHRVMDKCGKDDRPCIFSEDCFEPEERKPLTNSDRIRAMSDEDLAYFLAYIWATYARALQKDHRETLRWLQQTKEEADEQTDI